MKKDREGSFQDLSSFSLDRPLADCNAATLPLKLQLGDPGKSASYLFNHFVGAGEDYGRDREA